MTDYAAAPSEPIVQGLLTLINNGVTPFFSGKGVSAVFRTPVAATPPGNALGDFTLVLDAGLPGDVGLDPAFGRSLIEVRGSALAVPAGSTSIDEKAINYATVVGAAPPVTPPTFPIGANAIRIILSAGGVPTDPFDADGDGVEIVLWRGYARDPNYQVQIIGPLYQPVQIL